MLQVCQTWIHCLDWLKVKTEFDCVTRRLACFKQGWAWLKSYNFNRQRPWRLNLRHLTRSEFLLPSLRDFNLPCWPRRRWPWIFRVVSAAFHTGPLALDNCAGSMTVPSCLSIRRAVTTWRGTTWRRFQQAGRIFTKNHDFWLLRNLWKSCPPLASSANIILKIREDQVKAQDRHKGYSDAAFTVRITLPLSINMFNSDG